MKPRIGVYLSERMATRLAAAAARTGASKSALVEAALDHFLGSDAEVGDAATVASGIAGLSRQLERLERDIKIANETVALHARFHLAVTPPMPAIAQRAACTIGSERFEEFASQVGRRVELGTSLIQETMDRRGATKIDPFVSDLAELHSLAAESTLRAPAFRTSTRANGNPERSAAVREDGSTENFPGRTGGGLQ